MTTGKHKQARRKALPVGVFVTEFMGNYFLREFNDERRIIAMCTRKSDAWRIRCALKQVCDAAERQETDK